MQHLLSSTSSSHNTTNSNNSNLINNNGNSDSIPAIYRSSGKNYNKLYNYYI